MYAARSRALLLLCAAAAVVGCSNPSGLDTVQVSPTSQSLAVGQTVQFTATGTYGNSNHSSTQNITGGVTWTSSIPSVATISSSGVATAVGAGTTTITANATAYNGPVSSSSVLTVTGPISGTGGSGGSILSLTIIPSSVVFGSLGESAQLLAIGTFSTAPTVRDLTNSVTWLTSGPNQYPVTNNSSAAPTGGSQNGGVVSAYVASSGSVGAVITAEATDSNGSIATATTSVGCPLVLPNLPTTPGSCYQSVPLLLATLTVYNEGLNTTTWELTALPAYGTQNVITCGPAAGLGKSVCTATYPVGTLVKITATGGTFGGWSSNCTNTTITPVPTCTIPMTFDETVGAIFN
jgi:hypothetical protein